ncbi:hypothetical protein TNCV_2312331 [Trichonephila clavipes]|nr:hypothetical protein TNCV_2312331 [Trichonephila clavipes]
MRDSIITSHDPIREHPLSSLPRKQISVRPRKYPQRLARPISSLLHASMTIKQFVQHLLTGYGMEARFASHMPSNCTEGTECAESFTKEELR